MYVFILENCNFYIKIFWRSFAESFLQTTLSTLDNLSDRRAVFLR